MACRAVNRAAMTDAEQSTLPLSRCGWLNTDYEMRRTSAAFIEMPRLLPLEAASPLSVIVEAAPACCQQIKRESAQYCAAALSWRLANPVARTTFAGHKNHGVNRSGLAGGHIRRYAFAEET